MATCCMLISEQLCDSVVGTGISKYILSDVQKKQQLFCIFMENGAISRFCILIKQSQFVLKGGDVTKPDVT